VVSLVVKFVTPLNTNECIKEVLNIVLLSAGFGVAVAVKLAVGGNLDVYPSIQF